MSHGAPLTACLIVQNEQERLPACLASVAFCDEVVVVDGGSRDRTVEIARAAGAHVVEHTWSGFAAQRNVALDHATHDWVLEIDADERVSERLREEITRFVKALPPGVDIGGLPLRHTFLGRSLGPAGRYPMYRRRLLRRSRYRHDETRAVHEGLGASGAVHPFEGHLEHRLADTWGEALGDRWRYARLEARHLRAPAGGRDYLVGIVARPAAKLMWRVVVFGGWRDGWQGFVHMALDSVSDSVVWMRLLARRLSGGQSTAEQPPKAAPDGGHFGRRANLGSVRLVGVADGDAATDRAQGWLRQAHAAGADVALVASSRAHTHVRAHARTQPPFNLQHHLHTEHHQATDVRVRLIDRLTPLALIRGLDAEEQLRAIDVVVTFGRRARWASRWLPRTVRGRAQLLDETATPEAAIEHGLAARG